MTDLQELWSSPPWSFDMNSFMIGALIVAGLVFTGVVGYWSLTRKNSDAED